MRTIKRRASITTMATAYADQSGDDLVIPEDLAALSDEDLSALADQARAAFDAAYGDGNGLTDETFAALAALTEGIEALQAETASRTEAAEARAAAAAELAARVRPADALATEGAEAAGEDDDDEEAGDGDDAEAEVAEEELVSLEASAAERREIRIPMANVRSRAAALPPAPTAEDGAPSIRDYMVASADGLGHSVGTGIDMSDAGVMLDRRLSGFAANQFEMANRSGRHIREQHALLAINRPMPEELQINSNGVDHVTEVMNRAIDESRLDGGSLVAAGGWCAPSEVLYDLIGEDESRDGLLSLPEIGVNRGGVSFTRGPDFRTLFTEITGFSFTEDDDVEGRYQPGENGGPNVVGPKPCYHVDCPPFEEHRLDVDGLCITAGLLQSRGYPEVLERTIRGALVAHDHRINGRMLAQMAAGSTQVTLPATQVGTAAPVLTAIELQTEHYRYSRRLARSTTLEAIFPYWVRGAIRSDLSRRLGVELLDISNERIDGWFRQRGINPQFVYNWQAIDTTATGSFTAWPTEVSFLLYSAGTWIRGSSPIITLDTIYDSVLLGNNDFTALFTEEGWFVAQRGQDSRVVTTSITADGATHEGVAIEHNGTLAA